MSDFARAGSPPPQLQQTAGDLHSFRRNLSEKSTTSYNVLDRDRERKQRLREYRVAARREKRNRKSDEKKQRKLNATILRRMTRNPHKYVKNIERNRQQNLEAERRTIRTQAVRQAQRLAAEHDPDGDSFNVGRVVKLEDGTIISLEVQLRRTKKALAELEQAKENEVDNKITLIQETPESKVTSMGNQDPLTILPNGIDPDRFARMNIDKPELTTKGTNASPMKKQRALEPRPPPEKPIIPEGISLPEGEENWLALWDISDDQLERRIIREKKGKAAKRKALRFQQRAGKAERRLARDEKRRIYREVKLTWKAIKEEQTREKTKLKAMEDEESRKIAVDVNVAERQAALDHCAKLGFLLANTPGVDEIKPRALGMKGLVVDFDDIEVGIHRSTIKSRAADRTVDLGNAPDDAITEYIPSSMRGNEEVQGEFIRLDVGKSHDFEIPTYNHKLRRKLRRAIDDADVRKEFLVRQRTIDQYTRNNMDPPVILLTPPKPLTVKGQRILENGTLETAKQERVRIRMDLTEYNTAARVLRKQAKQYATEAGLRKHAELTGKLPYPGEPVKLTPYGG